MPLFQSSQPATDDVTGSDDLAAFQQRVIDAARGIESRVPQARHYTGQFLRDLGLHEGPTGTTGRHAEETKTITGSVDVDVTLRAVVSEALAAQVDGYSEADVEQVLRQGLTVAKGTRPVQVPQEVWDALNVSIEDVTVVEIDAV